jgi:hypothetical protein
MQFGPIKTGFSKRKLISAAFLLLATTTLTAQQLLPDAPQETSHTPATITGVVSDILGALIPNAEIKLVEKDHPGERQLSSDSDGRFTFADVAPGTYNVVISSPGLETFLSPAFTLKPGEKYELPDIALPIASASTTVDVVMTQSQVADEELKLETKQRVLGVLPSFYTSFLWNAAPLNTRQKFRLSLRAATDPYVFVDTAITAGIQQSANTFPDWGNDTTASYFKRYAAAYGDTLIGHTLGSAIYPAIFHQDPRYFYMGPGSSFPRRLKHALLAGVVARGDNDRWQPNYSHILGNASAGAISSVWHPASDSPQSLALNNALLGIADGAIQGLLREFIFPHITTKVPSYARGKAAADVPESAATVPAPGSPK